MASARDWGLLLLGCLTQAAASRHGARTRQWVAPGASPTLARFGGAFLLGVNGAPRAIEPVGARRSSRARPAAARNCPTANSTKESNKLFYLFLHRCECVVA